MTLKSQKPGAAETSQRTTTADNQELKIHLKIHPHERSFKSNFALASLDFRQLEPFQRHERACNLPRQQRIDKRHGNMTSRYQSCCFVLRCFLSYGMLVSQTSAHEGKDCFRKLIYFEIEQY